MNFGFILSLLAILIAVVSVFLPIPIVTNYAFWFAIFILMPLSRDPGIGRRYAVVPSRSA